MQGGRIPSDVYFEGIRGPAASTLNSQGCRTFRNDFSCTPSAHWLAGDVTWKEEMEALYKESTGGNRSCCSQP